MRRSWISRMGRSTPKVLLALEAQVEEVDRLGAESRTKCRVGVTFASSTPERLDR